VRNVKAGIMFKYTNAFSGFSVDDIQKAKAFYGEVMGMPLNERSMGVLELQIGSNNKIFVYPKPNHVPATYTVLNFVVENIEQAVVDLAGNGVQFEHYNEGTFVTDAQGIFRGGGPLIAWFKDPAGNIISVIEAGSM
jgi:catechol 2,3-dioxygenase-like lactoylglutathione lyase family enzyme